MFHRETVTQKEESILIRALVGTKTKWLVLRSISQTYSTSFPSKLFCFAQKVLLPALLCLALNVELFDLNCKMRLSFSQTEILLVQCSSNNGAGFDCQISEGR